MKKSVSVLAVVCVLIFASVLQAGRVLYVDVNSPNDPGSGSVDDPFRRIQDAINEGVVYVDDGMGSMLPRFRLTETGAEKMADMECCLMGS